MGKHRSSLPVEVAFHYQRNGSAPRSPACHLATTAGRRSVSQTLGLDQERVHKSRAVCEGGCEQKQTVGRIRDGRRGVWQPKYWEHTLEDAHDFERHFDYIHYNPVQHGLVRCPRDWPWSSFHRWVRAGVYPENWAYWENDAPSNFDDMEETVGE